MKSLTHEAVSLADEEKVKYEKLLEWLNFALIELEQVRKPLVDFFVEYQVTCLALFGMDFLIIVWN